MDVVEVEVNNDTLEVLVADSEVVEVFDVGLPGSPGAPGTVDPQAVYNAAETAVNALLPGSLTTAVAAYFAAHPYPAVPDEVRVGPNTPTGTWEVWVQTGLGSSGNDFTIWFNE